MKKLLMIVAVAMAVATAKAASVDWTITGTSADTGTKFYLLTALADSYESADALAAASLDNATIVKSGRTYSTGAKTTTDDAVTATSMKNAYLVVVTSDTSYTYYKADLSAYTYDVNNQESAPATPYSTTAATILGGTSANFAAVPEPTSGLLMLLGVAGLALRRRRA